MAKIKLNKILNIIPFDDKATVMNYISTTDYENISILCASRELNNLIYKIYDESKESNVELCFKHNLSLLKDDYDYIIIDNSPFKSYLTTCAMCASNKIITPICVDNFSYDGLMSLFDTIEDLNAKYALSIEFAGMFMTRVAGRTGPSCFQTQGQANGHHYGTGQVLR